MKAVHFGAGNVGRGFIGNILHNSGYEILFIDMDEKLVNQIHNDKSYLIEIFDEDSCQIKIGNVDAILGSNSELVIKELVTADLITTSVGANNLKYLAQNLKSAFLEREKMKNPVSVLANENTINATDKLAFEIFQLCNAQEKKKILSVTNFVNTVIDRQAMSKEELGKSVAVVEKYFEWVIQKNEKTKEIETNITLGTFVDDLTPYIERKLFLVNAEHAALAYLGKLFGYKTVQTAAQDKEILNLVKEMSSEIVLYFEKKYGMNVSNLKEFASKTLSRHTNPKFSDEVERVGRSPIRKLGPGDRLISPLVKLEKLSLKNSALKRIIASVLLYENEFDDEAVELQNIISKNGVAHVLKNLCLLTPSLVDSISEYYQTIKQDNLQIFNEV